MSSGNKTNKRTCPKCQFEDETGLRICPRDGMTLTARAKDPLIGQMIAEKYEILQMLGKGGMSVVYQARHTMMNRLVAVKMLRPELVAVPQLLQRFKQESHAVSALRHANVVTVFDFGLLPNGTPYLIMDYLEGDTLSAIIKRDHFLQPERAVHLFLQACDALSHSHDQGVIHRDIKPANLLIRADKSGEEYLTIFDFGIAKLLGQDGSTIHKLTTSGEVFGSPLYMSPEQCSGEHVSAKTDVYSMACVFFECLAGSPPLVGASPMETLMKHVNDMPISITETNPNIQIPQILEDAILSALNKDPEARPDMRQLRDYMRQAHQQIQGIGQTTSAPSMTSSNLNMSTAAKPKIEDESSSMAAIPDQPLGSQSSRNSAVQPPPAVPRATSSGAVPPPPLQSTSSTSNPSIRRTGGNPQRPKPGARKTTGKSKTKVPLGGGTPQKDGMKVPMPLLLVFTVVALITGICVVLNTFIFHNSEVIVVPSEDTGEKKSGTDSTSSKPSDGEKSIEVPFDGELSVAPVNGTDLLQLSTVEKRFKCRVDYDGKLVSTLPPPLLSKPLEEDATADGEKDGKKKHTTMKCMVVPVDLKPANISCQQAAPALLKKIFDKTPYKPKWEQIKDKYGSDATTDDVLIQEITFSKEDGADAEGAVKEYVVYLKQAERLVACQFIPIKITEQELEQTIEEFVPSLVKIVKPQQ